MRISRLYKSGLMTRFEYAMTGMRKVQRTMRGIIHIIPGVASGCEILLKTRPFPYSLAIKERTIIRHVSWGITLFMHIGFHYRHSRVRKWNIIALYKDRTFVIHDV